MDERIPVTGGDERARLDVIAALSGRVAEMFADHPEESDEAYAGAGYCTCEVCQVHVPLLERALAALRSIQPAPVAVASEDAKRLATEAENIVYNVRQWELGKLPSHETMDLILTTLDRCAAALRSVVPVPADATLKRTLGNLANDLYGAQCEIDDMRQVLVRQLKDRMKACAESINTVANKLLTLPVPEAKPNAAVVIRKPIGVAMVQDTDTFQGGTLVVCDDGTAWWMGVKNGEQCWRQYPTAIPGTVAASVQERTSGNKGDTK